MKQFILMSDIIDSGNKPQNLLIGNFKKCTQYINEKYDTYIISPLTITLGDEFQGLISDFKSAVKIILDLEEFIIENNYQFKLRYVLFYGKIETSINKEVAYEMLGRGLTDARNVLNNLKTKDERFHIDIQNNSKNIICNNAFNIYQNIVDKWKLHIDYEIISGFIKSNDYKIVAEDLQKNRSLMWKREKTLNISSYLSVKEILIEITKI